MQMTYSWKTYLAVLGLAIGSLGLTSHTWAAEKAAGAGRPGTGLGFLATLERSVGISPEQRDAIRGLMAQQREAVKKVRQETDTKIRAVLTPEQQKKFDAFLAEQKAKRGNRGA